MNTFTILSFLWMEEIILGDMGMARRKKKTKADPLMYFIYRTCKHVERLTSTLVESLINVARGKGLAKNPLETLNRIIRFAKRYVRLEPDAVTYIQRKFGFIPIPRNAMF